MTETELLRLALLGYEAAADPAIWPHFLERYAAALNADAAFLQLHDFQHRKSRVVAGFAISNSVEQSYHQHYSKLNIWRDRGRNVLRAGRAVPDEQVCARHILTHSEFYNDYLLKVGLTRSLAAVIASDDQQALSMPAMRSEPHRSFSKDESTIAAHLLPHLARADIIRRRLELLSAGEETLDRLPYGVVFLSKESRAVHWNRMAEAILNQRDGLELRSGVLFASGHGDLAAFQKALRKACEADASMRYPLPVLVQRKSLRRPYQILLAPLRKRFSQFIGMQTPVLIALLIDPERKPVAGSHLLETLYGLTPKEAVVAMKLAEGKSTEALAEELGMRYETARTHVRRILDKTGVSRQAELVRLVLTTIQPAAGD